MFDVKGSSKLDLGGKKKSVMNLFVSCFRILHPWFHHIKKIKEKCYQHFYLRLQSQ